MIDPLVQLVYTLFCIKSYKCYLVAGNHTPSHVNFIHTEPVLQKPYLLSWQKNGSPRNHPLLHNVGSTTLKLLNPTSFLGLRYTRSFMNPNSFPLLSFTKVSQVQCEVRDGPG